MHNAIHAAIARPTRIVGNAAKLIEAAWPAMCKGRRQRDAEDGAARDVEWVAQLGAAAERRRPCGEAALSTATRMRIRRRWRFLPRR